MKSSLILLSAAVIALTGASASREVKPLADAMKANPEWFTPGEVSLTIFNGIKTFIFSGKATRSFSEEKEHDFELWEEAERDAKSRFYEYAKVANDGNVKMKMSGCVTLYQYRNGDDYYRVLSVAVKDVAIEKIPQGKQNDAEISSCKPVAGLPVKECCTNSVSVAHEASTNTVATADTNVSNAQHDCGKKEPVKTKSLLDAPSLVRPSLFAETTNSLWNAWTSETTNKMEKVNGL